MVRATTGHEHGYNVPRAVPILCLQHAIVSKYNLSKADYTQTETMAGRRARWFLNAPLGPALRTPDQASCPGSVSHAAIAAQVIGSVASYAIHA